MTMPEAFDGTERTKRELRAHGATRAPSFQIRTSSPTASARTKRRVLLLLEDLGGGTGNHVCRMVSLWKLAGWEVVVVTPMTPLVRQLPAEVDVRVVRNTAWYHRFPLVQ